VAVAKQCADLEELEWAVTDAEWWVEDAQFFFGMDCPEPIPNEIRLDRVPRDLHRVQCSLAGGAQQCARTTSQYRRLAKSWQSRAKRHAGSIIQRKARCDDATRELKNAKAQLERAQQAVEACKGGNSGGSPIGGVSGGTFQPKITYTSLPYYGPRLDTRTTESVRNFVNRVRGAKTRQGYCQKELEKLEYRNSATCSGGKRNHIGFDIVVEFEEQRESSEWHFDIGVDFGLGGVIFVDGQQVSAYRGDIWWRRSENHANHLGFNYTFSQGQHTLELLGAEKCCDGPSRVKFDRNGNGRRQDMELVSIDALT